MNVHDRKSNHSTNQLSQLGNKFFIIIVSGIERIESKRSGAIAAGC